MTTPTAAITLCQVAALADLGPDYFSRHRNDLPPTTTVPTGAPGRPQKAFDIADLARLIVERTGHLPESVVRLRLALAMHTGPLRIVTVEGRHHVVHDAEPLSDLDPAIAQAVLEQVRRDNAAAESRRKLKPTVEESQP